MRITRKLSLFLALPATAMLTAVAAGQTSSSYTQGIARGTLTPAGKPVEVTAPVTGDTEAGCAVTFYTSRATFTGAVGGLCNLEDFECSSPPVVQLHAEPLWVCTSDVAVSPGCIEGGLAIHSSAGGGVVTLQAGLIGQPSVVAGANFFAEFTNLDFSNEPTAVGFDIFSNGAPPDPVQVRVFDCDGNLLGSQNFNANNATPTFAGVEVGAGCPPIWRIEVESLSGSGEIVDDVLYSGQCNPVLGPDTKYVTAGGNVTLAISEAAANSLAIVFVTSVNGVPFLVKVLPITPVSGQVCLGPVVVPPAPSGTTFGLTAFLADPVTGFSTTNVAAIIWN